MASTSEDEESEVFRGSFDQLKIFCQKYLMAVKVVDSVRDALGDDSPVVLEFGKELNKREQAIAKSTAGMYALRLTLQEMVDRGRL